MIYRFGTLLLALTLAQPLLAEGDSPPTKDRVGFPEGYQQNYTVLRSFVKDKQQQLVTVYGNLWLPQLPKPDSYLIHTDPFW